MCGVAQAVAVVQPAWRGDPVEEMAALGFGKLRLMDKISGKEGVAMRGSGRKMSAYIFMKP